MSEQYRVDLSELEGTITKLNNVLRSMGDAKSHAANQTYLPAGALGTFEEADDLTSAHAQMKAQIEDIIAYLHQVMDQFGSNTKKVHGAYSNAEYETQTSMSGGGN